MHPGLAALAATQGGVFTTAQARAHGYEDKEIGRLLDSAWQRLRRGVYTERGRYEGADEYGRHRLGLAALRLSLQRDVVVTHASAAVLHGLPLHAVPLDLLHVTRPTLRASRVEAGVHHHAAALPRHHAVVIDGHRVSSLARTAVDVARENTFAAGVVTADAALHAGATPDELREVIELCGQWPGACTASRVVAFADGRAESVGESLARILFADEALPQPELQVPLYDEDGLIGLVDFLFRGHRTVVEFDGKTKYVLPDGAGGQTAADIVFAEKRREDRIRALGFVVVRITWADLHRGPATAARIRRAFVLAAGRAAGIG